MRKITFLFAFVMFFATAMMAQNQTLVKTFNTNESASVKFNFKNKEIKPDKWTGDPGVRVELEIKANMPQQVMEQLVKAGRYTLEGVQSGDEYVINAPNLEKSVTVAGTDLQEEITVIVRTEEKYLVEAGIIKKDLGVAMARGNEAAVKEMKKMKQETFVSIRLVSTLKSQPTNFKLKRGDILIGGQPVEIE